MSIPTLGMLDRCIFNAASGGTGAFFYASNVNGYQSPGAAGAVNGTSYGYAAQSADLSQWEYGYGTWDGTALARTVLGGTNGTNPVNFTAPPAVLITALAETLYLPGLPAISPDSPMDTLIGVSGGTMLGQVTLINVYAFPPAPGNITLWVSTLGSDSNPGTEAEPFATLQHGVDVGGSYNYVDGLTSPSVNVEDGTYVIDNEILLPGLVGLPTGVINCNPATPGNVFFDCSASGANLFFAAVGNSNWLADGFEVNTPNAVFFLANFSSAGTQGNDIVVNDSSEGGRLYVADVFAQGTFNINGSTVTVLCTEISAVAQTQSYGITFYQGGTVIFQPNTFSHDGSFLASGFSQVFTGGTTFTNTNTFTSVGVNAFEVAYLQSPLEFDPSSPDYPGFPDDSSGIFVDQSSFLDGVPQLQVFSTLPTTSDLPLTGWVVAQVTGSGVYIVANNSGTIVKQQLT